MLYVYLYLIAIPSPLVWVLNAEAITIFFAAVAHRPIYFVVPTMVLGQTTCFALLYFFGEKVLFRWGWLARKVRKLELERYARHGPAWVLAAAVLGFPPLTAFSVGAHVLKIRFRVFMPLVIGGRVFRLLALALLPTLIFSDLRFESLPEWVKNLG